ncbi:hypothetical protein J1C56_28350 [Aminobacter anthyllidis]|uniref:Uncharacterized protein n=1 Tax=Aminobacter anthyllidis TaxID=1035067 RepID=A0A9X1D901_9HYPH|nr:hypothetical protein [Aminobacter anthyllidis]MBT1159483.1 hypothetical protein [Aminobacter anthyllidis]
MPLRLSFNRSLFDETPKMSRNALNFALMADEGGKHQSETGHSKKTILAITSKMTRLNPARLRRDECLDRCAEI